MNKPSADATSEETVLQIETFEWHVQKGECQQALDGLERLLTLLDKHYGEISGKFSLQIPLQELDAESKLKHASLRLAHTISELFLHKNCVISEVRFVRLCELHRWIAMVFAATAYFNADHLITRLAKITRETSDATERYQLWLRSLLLLTIDSSLKISWDALWRLSPQHTAALALALMTPRLIATAQAQRKREYLLEWLPEKLAQLKDLQGLPLKNFHDVAMHTSYAQGEHKHRLKIQLNRLLRESFQRVGVQDRVVQLKRKKKPTLLVVLEWFRKGHSIYRTHSKAIEACHKDFHVIGAGLAAGVDETGRGIFKEFHVLEELPLKKFIQDLSQLATEKDVDIIYYPSMGMFLHTMVAALFRIAPLQFYSWGHPATTHSPALDGYLIDENLANITDETTHSEPFIVMPSCSQPYQPLDTNIVLPRVRSPSRTQPAVIKIAVAATAMKLNSPFLLMCKRIAEQAKVATEFHFLTGSCFGMMQLQLKQMVYALLPKAIIHGHQHVQSYLEKFAQCDISLNPFPFGNHNGVIDAMRLGIPGVCLQGKELHSNFDPDLFRRFALPEELIALDETQYLHKSLRLIEDHDFRYHIQKHLAALNPDQLLCNSDAGRFSKALLDHYQSRLKSH